MIRTDRRAGAGHRSHRHCVLLSRHHAARSGEQRGVYSCRLHAGSGYRINRAAAGRAAYAGGQCYGANAHSPFFYNRVKGEMEEALIAQNWQKLTIARPSMLLGDRSKQRMNETLLRRCSVCYRNWKSIDARDVARVMLAEAMRPEHEGVTILSSSELRKRAE